MTSYHGADGTYGQSLIERERSRNDNKEQKATKCNTKAPLNCLWSVDVSAKQGGLAWSRARKTAAERIWSHRSMERSNVLFFFSFSRNDPVPPDPGGGDALFPLFVVPRMVVGSKEVLSQESFKELLTLGKWCLRRIRRRARKRLHEQSIQHVYLTVIDVVAEQWLHGIARSLGALDFTTRLAK